MLILPVIKCFVLLATMQVNLSYFRTNFSTPLTGSFFREALVTWPFTYNLFKCIWVNKVLINELKLFCLTLSWTLSWTYSFFMAITSMVHFQSTFLMILNKEKLLIQYKNLLKWNLGSASNLFDIITQWIK